MILLQPRVPAPVVRAALRGVDQLVAPFMLPALVTANSGDLAIAAPHRVYVVDFPKSGKLPRWSAARSSGWRFIVLHGRVPIAAISVGSSRGSKSTEKLQARLNHGPLVNATVDAIQKAERSTRFESVEYKAHLLTVPALLAAALWLQPVKRNSKTDEFGDELSRGAALLATIDDAPELPSVSRADYFARRD
jgi:hypothetical protein